MSAKIQVGKYFAALECLIACGEPTNNDAVALEAGGGRGSIKNSRPIYAELIAAIDVAAEQQTEIKVASDPVPRLRMDIEDLTRRLDQSLDREGLCCTGSTTCAPRSNIWQKIIDARSPTDWSRCNGSGPRPMNHGGRSRRSRRCGKVLRSWHRRR
jgi:hypothetical protein